MTPQKIGIWFLLLAGAFVAGSEIIDLFIEEKNFTTDHFLLGTGLIATAVIGKK
jgi:hypothetical protein